MISYIKGKLEHVFEHAVVLDQHGMGFEIQASPATISRINKDAEVKLHTYLHVKEDGLTLYGFLTLEEINLFNLLITVSGIGPKVAMGMIAAMTPSQLMIAIITDDVAALSRAPGVGKKTAQRISLELKDKIKTGDAVAETIGSPQQSLALASSEKQDAIDALSVLGYSRSEAMKAVMEVAVEGLSTEQIIKHALKKLAR